MSAMDTDDLKAAFDPQATIKTNSKNHILKGARAQGFRKGAKRTFDDTKADSKVGGPLRSKVQRSEQCFKAQAGQPSKKAKTMKGVRLVDDPEVKAAPPTMQHGKSTQRVQGKYSHPSQWPKDWPSATGAIDLARHDLPHSSADTEWWYVNSHVKTPSGRDYSVFASFFRIVTDWNDLKNEYDHTHCITWAIVDPEKNKYYYDCALPADAPRHTRRSIEDDNMNIDPLIKRAMLEVCDKGNITLPDRMYYTDARCPTNKLDLDYGGNTFYKDANGSYVCHCESKEGGFSFDLKFTASKSVVRQGDNGVVKVGLKADEMFYYFIPRMSVEGSIALPDGVSEVSGMGWYDHEFGGTIRAARPGFKAPPKQDKANYSWNWLALQLDDGTDITATTVLNPDEDMAVLDNYALVIYPDGSRVKYDGDDMQLNGVTPWLSVRTMAEYFTSWQLIVPKLNLKINLEASMPEQELVTLIGRPAFWEGRVTGRGTMNDASGRPTTVSGVGFIERAGFGTIRSLNQFFKKCSKLVRKEIAKILPLTPSFDDVAELMADTDNLHFMEGVDLDVFTKTMIEPVRTVVDRGGKAWRSYALCLCIDAVGGDSEKYRHWLAMPELMHVGSLIVDDIQDESDTRRGGKCIHHVIGEALAINCGTSAYFVALSTILNNTPGLSEMEKRKLYDLYFLTLRAAHAGQAFDINGLDYMMDEVVLTGNNTQLVKRVVCTHRLKSAVPAGSLAKMGCMLGKGSAVQSEALARYFESIGVAFQIIDDVLNLRGLPGKTKGEDLMAGKITYPVALALNSKRMDKDQRRALWGTIKAKPQDPQVVDNLVHQIEECGALSASVDDAETMVESAWHRLDPVIPDSFYKNNLRAFGWFVLRRHY